MNWVSLFRINHLYTYNLFVYIGPLLFFFSSFLLFFSLLFSLLLFFFTTFFYFFCLSFFLLYFFLFPSLFCFFYSLHIYFLPLTFIDKLLFIMHVCTYIYLHVDLVACQFLVPISINARSFTYSSMYSYFNSSDYQLINLFI